MIDELLRVLRLEQIGKKIQAKQIEDIYYKNIADHTLCINCRKGKMDPLILITQNTDACYFLHQS